MPFQNQFDFESLLIAASSAEGPWDESTECCDHGIADEEKRVEGRVDCERPDAAFAFSLVAVCSRRSPGTMGSGSWRPLDEGSVSRNGREGGFHGSLH